MRTLFSAALLVSLVAAAAIGSAAAWRASDSARGAALVGKNAFSIRYEPNCDGALVSGYPAPADESPEPAPDPQPIPCHTLIGPNGATTQVGKGVGQNQGDFPLRVVGGELAIRNVVGTTPIQPEANDCRPEHFSGSINVDSQDIIRPGEQGGAFRAAITVDADAPPSCQGKLVFYRVTIVAENPLDTAPARPDEN